MLGFAKFWNGEMLGVPFIRRFFLIVLPCMCLVSCAGGGSSYVRRHNVIYTPPEWSTVGLGEIFRPNSDKPTPAVLLIHGGVKLGDDGRWVMNGLARKLARNGYFVLNITYRDGTKWSYPAPLRDVQEGLKWLKTNAAAEGIDPQRIAVYGYSAGGYLGALAALKAEEGGTDVKAIIAGATPTDLAVYAKGSLIRGFLGGGGDPSEELLIDASPLTHITRNSPPVFMYHGEKDVLVRPDHAEKFAFVLQQFGVPHETYWLPDKGHISAFFFPDGAIDAAIAFLDRYLK